MTPATRSKWTIADYEQAAREYCDQLPLEHFMEGEDQATQREITLASLALVKVHVPDLQVFNELLVQYWFEGQLREVVPDNMLRRCLRDLASRGSFITEYEPVQPLVVMEYVSPTRVRKDYKDSYRKYERELKVPYFLLFSPHRQDLRLHKHTGDGYVLVAPNAAGRVLIPELELEAAILDRWMRFWFRGELLPLPAELLRQLTQVKEQALQEKRRADAAEAEVARLRAMLEQLQRKADSP